jgi:hypothetical protein
VVRDGVAYDDWTLEYSGEPFAAVRRPGQAKRQPASQPASKPASQQPPVSRPAKQPAKQLTSRPAKQPSNQPGSHAAKQATDQAASQSTSPTPLTTQRTACQVADSSDDETEFYIALEATDDATYEGDWGDWMDEVRRAHSAQPSAGVQRQLLCSSVPNPAPNSAPNPAGRVPDGAGEHDGPDLPAPACRGAPPQKLSRPCSTIKPCIQNPGRERS